MPVTPTSAAEQVLREFEGAWRDDTPIFGCCRRSVETALEHADLLEIATLDVTARVQALRAAVERDLPGHLQAHRCCAGHLADVAFDLPTMIAPPADAEVEVERAEV
ncbi:MAG: hypothetical protein H0V93_00425 [Euzebyales bacterium]|jgi:hypothetical protein|nr:hypothetical protein [Euzebyales bacterium]